MAKRQRDYKAEYRRRKANAQQKGFTGYSQQRRARKQAQTDAETTKRIIRELQPTMLAAETIEEATSDEVAEDIWTAFRNYYAQQQAA